MDRWAGASVMYLPGKVIVIGGSPGGIEPTETAEFIDLTSGTPTWQLTSTSMAHKRRHLHATPVATGPVLVTGGTSNTGTDMMHDNPAGAVREAELWDRTATPPWRPMASYADAGLDPLTYRGYHSTALLLPDGRVVSGGGNYQPIDTTMEIFWPPYLFQPNSNVPAPRPILTQAPATMTYGATFTVQIQTTPAHNIIRATFLRLGSVTHSVNMGQRFVELAPPVQNGGTVQVTPPANSNLAPPGYYVLFLINHLGVPSVGAPPKAAILRLQ